MRAVRLFATRWPQLLLASGIALNVAMLGSLEFGYLDRFFHEPSVLGRGHDFYSIYLAGDAILDRQSIYQWAATSEVVPYSSPYRYPPAMAYAIALPLNALSAEHAYWLWIVAIECMLVLNAWLSFRLCSDRALGFVAASAWFLFTPLYLELYHGQWSLLMATITFLAAIAFLKHGAWAAAVPWTVSLMIKANSALLAPVFIRHGAIAVVVASAAAVILINAPHFLIEPGDIERFWNTNTQGYRASLESREFSFWTLDHGLLALVSVVWLWIDVDAAAVPSWVSIGTAVLVTGVSLTATFAGKRNDAELLIAMWLSVYFLVYPDVWEHHYVMLLPALVILFARRDDFRILAVCVFGLLALPTPFVLFDALYTTSSPSQGVELQWPAWASITYHTAKPVPVLVLWLSLCWALTFELEPRAETATAPDSLAATH